MKYGLFVYELPYREADYGFKDDRHLEGFDEYSEDPEYLVKTAKMMMQDFRDEFVPGTFSFEVWPEDENGEYGMSGKAYWKDEISLHP